MNVEYYNDGYPYIVIDDLYSYDQLDLIWREIDFLIDGDKLDVYKTEREAMKTANEFVKQYRKSR